MDEKLRRSWFRFHLSTVLLLTAIAAWVMACWPWWGPQDERQLVVAASSTTWQDNLLLPGERYTAVELGQTPAGEVVRIGIARYGLNPHLKWPGLAVAAFLAWKLTWRIAERRLRMSSDSAA